MSYLIDTRPGWNEPWRGRDRPEAVIVQVGCGGTGGFLAEAIARLLLGVPSEFYLVDPDRVEERNLLRQAFSPGDTGRFKAQVLAERLARRFGRQVGYAVRPYDLTLHARVFAACPSQLALVVGCVDNAPARRAITDTLDAGRWSGGVPGQPPAIWYLDLGNGQASGQLLLGNAMRPEHLRGAFLSGLGRCRALPAPGMQRPDLLAAPPVGSVPAPEPNCAEAVANDEQSRTINQVMAALAAGCIEQLLAGTAGWMAQYIDLDNGTLRVVPANPMRVAEIAGLHRATVDPRGQCPSDTTTC